MVSDLGVVCRMCSKNVRLDQIKFDDVHSAYVCDSCFGKSHKFEDNAFKNPLVSAAEKSITSLNRSLVKFTCSNCKYHFSRRKDKPVSVCPYCGSSKLGVLGDSNSILLSV